MKTLLLASAAVMIAAPALAGEDITAAFYTPAQGKFLSDTSLAMSRQDYDFGEYARKFKSAFASEELTYGITDNLAVFGKISNNFDKGDTYASLIASYISDADIEYNNDHNFAYDLGVKYNYNQGKVLGQAVLGYHTWDPKSWYGDNEGVRDAYGNRWQKAINGTVKLGYALDCSLTPYTTFTVDSTVDQANRDIRYTWFVGAHKMLDKVSLDAGVRYEFGKFDIADGRWKYEGRDFNYERWYAQAEANYFVKENVTVGLFGKYYIGGRERKDVDYDYTIGLNAKVAF